MSDQKHLLITFTWSINNIGDIGITPGLLNLIDKRYPEMPTVVMTYQYAVEGESCSKESDELMKQQFSGAEAVEYLKNYLPQFHQPGRVLATPFAPRLGTAQDKGKPGSAWEAFHNRWGETQLIRFENGSLQADKAAAIADDILNRFPLELYAELERGDPEAATAVRRAGFVLFNSGTVMNFGRLGVRNFYGYTLQFLMPLIMARALKIPYGTNGHSFEAIEWPVEMIVRPLFKDAKFVFCRDSDSLEYLQQKNLAADVKGYRPDSTFFFNAFDDKWADDFMARHGLENRKFLSLITRIPSDHAHWHDATGGVISRERRTTHIDRLVEFVEKWHDTTGYPVVYCPETRGELERCKLEFVPRMTAKARAAMIIIEEFWTTEQAYSLFNRSRIVMSMEMHSIIMAMNVGTPVLHIPFGEAGRKARMMHDTGFPDWLLDIDMHSADEMLQQALVIHNDFDKSCQRLKDAMPRLEEMAYDVIERAKNAWLQES